MGDSRDIRQMRAARIVLICPDCGQENAEYAQMLQGKGTFYCTGEGCDYIFALASGRGASLAELCRRFYAALYLTGSHG
jgi:hypothetical protein